MAIKCAIKCAACLTNPIKPVVLPCGKTVCHKHIKTWESKDIFCLLCSDYHEIKLCSPYHATKTNDDEKEEDEEKENEEKDLIDLSSDNDDECCFNDDVDTNNSKENDNLIGKFCERFAQMGYWEPSEHIRTQIGDLKSKIETKREELKVKIDEEANKMMRLMDVYETECEARLKTKEFNERLKKFQLKSQEAQKQLSLWSKDEKQGKEPNEVKKMYNVVKLCEARLRIQWKGMKSELAMDKIMEFEWRCQEFGKFDFVIIER